MLWLPKPYPDEVIGSVIARGCIQTGVPFKRLISEIAGTSQSQISFLMASNIAAIATWCRVDPEELLLRHTMFPYTVAFMPKQTRDALRIKALNRLSKSTSLSSLTKNVSHGVASRRFCAECANEELERYGETYWHRSHMLPGALLCSRHGTALLGSAVKLRQRTQTRIMSLPHEVLAEPVEIPARPDALASITSISVKTLEKPSAGRNAKHLLAAYRKQVLALGLVLPSGDVDSVTLVVNFHRYFGKELLTNAGCDFNAPWYDTWPALMVRPMEPAPFAPVKHIFMESFLAKRPTLTLTYARVHRRPGKKTRDYVTMDANAADHLKTILARTAQCHERRTVKSILSEIEVWATFRHVRQMFPRTNALVQAFRASDQSERQLGKRLRWRKANRRPAAAQPTAGGGAGK